MTRYMPISSRLKHGRMGPMCGRYATTRARQELLDEFQVQLDAVDGEIRPDYNVAPTKQVPAVLDRRPKDAPEAAAVRQLRTVRWGLVPSWAKDISIGSRMINARVETVHEKPSYRRAFARRRCLLPADGYFEWYTVQDQATPRTRPGEKKAKEAAKQPYFIRPNDGDIMAMAGLYELWRVPGTARRRPGGSSRAMGLDVHGDHDERAGRPRPDPRPDADDRRTGPLGRLARSRG